MADDFILEIGCEEVPARALKQALNSLKERFEKVLDEDSLAYGKITTLGSARRLVVRVEELAAEQATHREIKLGPPKKIAFENGNPSKALEGFARKFGVAVEELSVIDTERGEYLGFEKEEGGRTASEILRERVPEVVGSLTFPKMMYWLETRQRFARPIRWVLALYAGKVVPIELFGVPSSKTTEGHRILGKTEIPVKSYDDYLRKLKKYFVLVSEETRRKKIESELATAALSLNGRVIPDTALLEEVIYINEYPTVLVGKFEERFLELPREVLISVMREHQKYFSLETQDGVLLPYFLGVMNTHQDLKNLIRVGHERVLKARLSDALFFWNADGKRSLEDRSKELSSIIFQKELGTYAEKVQRLLPLALAINDVTNAEVACETLETAVRWAKSDLTTGLVGEFPDLQGITGGLYALREGASDDISKAIYDQYRPLSMEDRSPDTVAAAVLSLADRLDTDFGCFSVGLVPTGSSDPLGLRRHTQSAIKILFDHRLPFSLSLVMRSDSRVDDGCAEAIEEFYLDRLRYILASRGFEHDEIAAVLATETDDPCDVLARVDALHAVRDSPDLEAVAVAFKRIKNIIRKAGNKESLQGEPVSETEVEPAERDLDKAIEALEPRVEGWVAKGEYRKVLEETANLRIKIDRFFDQVLVMHENEGIRKRRLILLNRLFETFQEVADISEVVVSD